MAAAQGDPCPSPVLPEPPLRGWMPLLLLPLFCAVMFFYGLDRGDLYRHEALRAVVAAEMLQSGNWIVPARYGEPFLTKPPGMYAAIAAASWPLGRVTEWTARLPSALAATAVVFLLYWYVSRQVGRLGGLLAAAVAPCTFTWLTKASAAEIDMLLVAWVAAGLLLFFRAVECHEDAAEAGGHRWTCGLGWWLAALLCVAGGVLTKWTAAAFFYAAVVPFLLWRGRLRLLISPGHLLGALLAAALCLGWIGAVVHQVGWEVFYQTIRKEALPRLSYVHQEDKGARLGAIQHPFRVLGLTLPWSAFALLTLMPGFSRSLDKRGRRLVQAFHCWAWPNLLLWSILPAHAVRYSFPLLPGITGLAALVWLAFLTGRMSPGLARVHRVLALLAVAGLVLWAAGGTAATALQVPRDHWLLAGVLVGLLVACAGLGLLAWRRGTNRGLLACIVLGWVVLRLAYVDLFVPLRSDERALRLKGQQVAQVVPADAPLYHVAHLREDGIMFYYGRPVVRVTSWRNLPVDRGPVYCLTTPAEWAQWRRLAGWQPTLELALADEEGSALVLVGIACRETGAVADRR